VVAKSIARARELQVEFNCFCLILEDEAMQAARRSDRMVAGGKPLGPLHGVPVAIQDMTPLAGYPLSNGSWSAGNQVADHTAPVVRRLQDAGAIVIGKTTTPEFAHSSFTASPRWGTTVNPWDKQRTSGGASGGSAVAVAGRCVPFAEGSDMGGSVRIPAAFCGVVGLKPSLGRIPMTLLPSQFDTLSHFGPLAQTVEDAILFMEATSGPSDEDILSLPLTFDGAAARHAQLAGRRFALSMNLGYYRVDSGVRKTIRRAIDVLAAAGAVVEEVSLPWTRAINDQWSDAWCVFMAAYFGDGLAEYRDRMDPAVVALIERGNTLGANAYKRIEILRTALWRDLAGLFRRFDALLCPTCAIPAPLASEHDADYMATLPDGRFKGLDMTCPFNMVSPCPAISLPIGLTPQGLPVGLQIVGRRHADEQVLGMALGVERALPAAGIPRRWPPALV
jgi:Asp-tRNA(Asn)/Glu-tRNA(Gln) amidotransferase A subunit family amidase